MNQLLEFTKYGVNAVIIFLYIRMQESILVSSKELKPKEHAWIALDNKNLAHVSFKMTEIVIV